MPPRRNIPTAAPRRSIPLIAHANIVFRTTKDYVDKLIDIFPFKTAEELQAHVLYTKEILSEIRDILKWQNDEDILMYERPAQLIIKNLIFHIENEYPRYQQMTNRDRFALLVTIKNELEVVIPLIRLAIQQNS